MTPPPLHRSVVSAVKTLLQLLLPHKQRPAAAATPHSPQQHEGGGWRAGARVDGMWGLAQGQAAMMADGRCVPVQALVSQMRLLLLPLLLLLLCLCRRVAVM